MAKAFKSQGILDAVGQAFDRVRGKLNSKDNSTETYSFNAAKGDRYSLFADALHPGENLRLILKNENGKIIKEIKDSMGSKNPYAMHQFESSGKFQLTVAIQEDEDNKGVIPYNLAIKNYDYVASNNVSTSPDVDATSQVSTDTDSTSTDTSKTSLNVLWEQAKKSGNITLADLNSFLSSTTSDGSTVSASEISTLQSIAKSLDNYVAPSLKDYYEYIFSAATGTNVANQYYTGGKALRSDRISLGNLQEGFTDDKVSLLCKKWFQGKDLPLAFMDGDSANGTPPSSFIYGNADGELFNGSPSYLQLAQGGAGTCYFLSSLNAVAAASNTKGMIEDMFIDNNDGTFGVRFYAPGGTGESAWVTVDRQLPIRNEFEDAMKMTGENRQPAYPEGYYGYYKDIETNLLWAGLAEKALAQVNETDILQRATPENSYAAIEGGLGHGLDFITGQADTLNTFSEFSQYASIDPTDDPLLLLSFSTWSGKPGETNFVKGHAYSVIDYDPTTKIYQVANPWGMDAPNYEAVFPVPAYEMEKLFNGSPEDPDGYIFLASLAE